jgi:sodium/pantothenate symporter
VALTDALQGVVMLIASVVVLVAVVMAGGGIEKCMTTLASIDPGLLTPTGPSDKVPQPMILSFWVLVGLGILGLPQTSQRCMAYKDSKSMHRAMIFGTVIISFLLLAMHLSAVLGRAVIPDLPAGDLAMPTLTVTLLPPVWAGIFIAGPMAAIMSTVDGMMLMASATLIKDIYIHYVLKGDVKAAPPAHIRKMSLGSTACIGVLVFLAALEPPDLLVWINLFAFGGLEATFLWPIILGLYWKKANAGGALLSVITGLACFFAISILKPPLGGIHPIVPTLVVALLAFIVGAYTGKASDETVLKLFWEEEDA